MSRQQVIVSVFALLAMACWAVACGDGAMEPPPPPPRATTVTVAPPTAELTALGATVQFSAEVRDQNGQVMGGTAVTWSSSAVGVATVNAGLATAAGNGTATITATAGSVSGAATVTVRRPLDLALYTLPAEENSSANVTDLDSLALAAGRWVRAATFLARRKVVATWSSSDSTVARVSVGVALGKYPLRSPDDVAIEALVPGKATLTATYEGSAVSIAIVVPGNVVERSMADRRDDVTGPQIHAVYVVASDGVDLEADRQGRVAWSLLATVDWLYDRLGRRLRVDTYNGQVDVTFLRVPETVAQIAERRTTRLIRERIKAASWYSGEKTYAIYYEGPHDDAGGVAGGRGGAAGWLQFAAVFSDSRGLDRRHFVVAWQPDFLGALENSMAHELFHTMGAVHEQCATNPAPDGSSHVGDDDTDLMAAGRRRGRILTTIDVNRDDYYDHNIPGCRDVADSPLWISP